MTNIELLNLAEKYDIDISKLYIAYGLEELLNDNLVNEQQFEELCEKVYNIYMSIDSCNVSAIRMIVLDTFYNEENKEDLVENYDNDLEEYVRKNIGWYL